ncbi:LuxR C-terminal-related transcriptional regulator [Paraburkholderia sp. CI3]|uniref:LuxR C-terminal-related transcriptional regulator n=1 Tax=Paraburkholderia sp. CI3 TaxID=2991060 RepID=UPI003D1C5506
MNVGTFGNGTIGPNRMTNQQSVANPEATLKISPPRAPRHMLARARLSSDCERFRNCAVTIVQAPPGFGKTSLLIQWRQEYLMHGSAVAWVSIDGHDDPRRLLASLTLAVRSGSGRTAFGRRLLEGGALPDAPIEGVTAWLAEVARTALDIVLILDEAEQLPQASLEALIYLLENLPANLRIVIASRAGFEKVIARLGPYGQCAAVDAAALRFRLDETIALIGSRLGAVVDADAEASARLHDIAEGWPLGLQIGLAAIADSDDPVASIDAFASSTGGIREQFITALLERLSSEDTEFLTRISIVDLLHEDLCEALTGAKDAKQRLLRLARETPLFFSAQGRGQWYRMHSMAREAIRAHLTILPPATHSELHRRAMHWLADHGMTEAAARHALACGQEETAYTLAQGSLHDAVTQGQLVAVLEWLEWLPEPVLDRHPRLRLAMAWALAQSDRQQEAEEQAQAILRSTEPDEAMRYEIDLILSAAAYFADEPDRAARLLDRWGDTPPVSDSWLLQVHANRLAVRAVMEGEYAKARQLRRHMPRGNASAAYRYVVRWRAYTTGLGYLLQGQMLSAERTLRPALVQADDDLGRRHPFSCMMAALLATTRFKRGDFNEAAALLANRLDVLERSGTPDAVIFAYRTAARVSSATGAEHRAFDLLETLHAIGTARRMPRLCVASLTEQIRLHSGRFRSASCRTLARRLEQIVAEHATADSPLKRRALLLHQHIAQAFVAIAEQDWTAADRALALAQQGTDAMKLGGVGVDLLTLHAFVLDRLGKCGTALLREAVDLGAAYGMSLTAPDLHPAFAEWLHERGADGAPRLADVGPPLPPTVAVSPAPGRDAEPRVAPSMVLTPKERSVLELTSRHLTNKEIALAMGVGQETVKWHMKNLFIKLDATSRRQIVRRAQLLGLLQET